MLHSLLRRLRYGKRSAAKPSNAQEVDDRLRKPPRVERNIEQEYPRYSPEFPHLQTRIDETEQHDGVWWCSSCRHENALIHRVGAHPFGHLLCGKCSHIFNDDRSTHILGKYVMEDADVVAVPAFDAGIEVPYGMVCSSCGMSHRAKQVKGHEFGTGFCAIGFRGVECECGKRSEPGERWYRFSIGPSHDWRGIK